MKLVSLLLCIITLLLINICIINSQQPKTITLSGFLYDHHPDINANFEPDLGALTKGIVKSTLNTTTRIPELVSLSSSSSANRNGKIVRPDLFQYFFTSAYGQNIEIPYNLTLNYDSNRGVYSYTNLDFFPIDDNGFNSNKRYKKYKDERGKERNFHMCLKINSNFKFNGNEIFNYASDDDLWVFINNKLELDLGGVHDIVYGSIDLSKLGLKINSNYPIDIFFCERHTIKSSIKIETNLFESCPWYDYCGVCKGDGSTCCNPEIDCNDNDKCTTDKCPSATTTIQSGKLISDYCIHTPISIPSSNDSCNINVCDSKTGLINSISSCVDKSNECLTNIGCNSITGCQYKTKCSNCGKCSNGICVAKNQTDCGIELDGIPNPCMNYYCDQVNGCIKKPKCSDPFDNKCQVSKCRVNQLTGQGECYNELKAEIDDNDPCTFDDCDPCSGLITHHYSNKCKSCKRGCN